MTTTPLLELRKVNLVYRALPALRATMHNVERIISKIKSAGSKQLFINCNAADEN